MLARAPPGPWPLQAWAMPEEALGVTSLDRGCRTASLQVSAASRHECTSQKLGRNGWRRGMRCGGIRKDQRDGVPLRGGQPRFPPHRSLPTPRPRAMPETRWWALPPAPPPGPSPRGLRGPGFSPPLHSGLRVCRTVTNLSPTRLVTPPRACSKDVLAERVQQKTVFVHGDLKGSCYSLTRSSVCAHGLPVSAHG